MACTNSSMVVYKKLSPNHSGQRTHSIDRITPHCVVGQCTAEGLGEWFENKSCPGNWMYARMGDLAEKVTKALQGSTDSGEKSDSKEKEVIRWYRVRKSWADAKSQKGAYKILDNAKKCADQNPGYKVFNADGKVVYEPKAAEPAVKVPFLVKVSISDLNIRTGPGTEYDRVQFITIGVYTIMEVRSGKGSSAGWSRLKSGMGWISLDFARRI